MSSNPSRHVACRLLGGSGRPQLVAVPARKLPALCAPFSRTPADAVVRLPGMVRLRKFHGSEPCLKPLTLHFRHGSSAPS